MINLENYQKVIHNNLTISAVHIKVGLFSASDWQFKSWTANFPKSSSVSSPHFFFKLYTTCKIKYLCKYNEFTATFVVCNLKSSLLQMWNLAYYVITSIKRRHVCQFICKFQKLFISWHNFKLSAPFRKGFVNHTLLVVTE